MEDLFKKVIFTGVGLVSVTAEKLQEQVDKLVSENKISSEEGKKVVDELIEDTQAKREEFTAQIKKIAEDAINNFKFVSYKEYEELLKRVEDLEGAAAAPKRKPAPKKKEVAA